MNSTLLLLCLTAKRFLGVTQQTKWVWLKKYLYNETISWEEEHIITTDNGTNMVKAMSDLGRNPKRSRPCSHPLLLYFLTFIFWLEDSKSSPWYSTLAGRRCPQIFAFKHTNSCNRDSSSISGIMTWNSEICYENWSLRWKIFLVST